MRPPAGRRWRRCTGTPPSAAAGLPASPGARPGTWSLESGKTEFNSAHTEKSIFLFFLFLSSVCIQSHTLHFLVVFFFSPPFLFPPQYISSGNGILGGQRGLPDRCRPLKFWVFHITISNDKSISSSSFFMKKIKCHLATLNDVGRRETRGEVVVGAKQCLPRFFPLSFLLLRESGHLSFSGCLARSPARVWSNSRRP